jgi:hypothetical protein
VGLSEEDLRGIIRWNSCYRSEWDNTPDRYADEGVVGWARSRRLGMLDLGRYKAYVGVQHVDPKRPGWGIVDEPQARFFASMFVGGRCVALRTFPSMTNALDALCAFLNVDSAGQVK